MLRNHLSRPCTAMFAIRAIPQNYQCFATLLLVQIRVRAVAVSALGCNSAALCSPRLREIIRYMPSPLPSPNPQDEGELLFCPGCLASTRSPPVLTWRRALLICCFALSQAANFPAIRLAPPLFRPAARPPGHLSIHAGLSLGSSLEGFSRGPRAENRLIGRGC